MGTSGSNIFLRYLRHVSRHLAVGGEYVSWWSFKPNSIIGPADADQVLSSVYYCFEGYRLIFVNIQSFEGQHSVRNKKETECNKANLYGF